MVDHATATTALLAVSGDASDERALAEQICRACIGGLDIDGASISLLAATPYRTTLFASDATATVLDELQFDLGEGPCIDAAATGRAVMIADLDHSGDARHWPVFASAVAEQTNARALFVVPLRWSGTTLGVLDLYRAVPGALSPEQYRDLTGVADIAALMMLDAGSDHGGLHAPRTGAWLDLAVSGRAEIHQASGMVLAQLGIDGTDALARLRAHAFTHQQPLLHVAAEVVARRLIFTDEMS